MADGDNTQPLVPASNDLLFRGWPKDTRPYSYFFHHQVQRCFTEQHKILDFQLTEKEHEAQIVYEKPITDLFSPNPQIESTFAKIIFDSKERVNLNGLIEELGTLACDETEDAAAVTRLLDLLFVIGNTSGLLEEQDIRNVRYDLYNEEAKGQFDIMAALPKLMSNIQKGPKRTEELAMMFSLLATGQTELISAALVYIANVTGFPWDALVLARHFFGVDHEVTKLVHTIWTEKVLGDSQFKMIEIACSLNNNDMLEVARKLLKLFNNKQAEPVAPIQAYRCLSIFLSAKSSQQSDLKMQLKMAEASRVMCDILMTILGFGKITWAKSMVDDLSKRAPPGEIPPDICQIGLKCLVELNELLLKTQNFISHSEPLKGDEFEKLALKWRGKINQGSEGMDKLKTDTGDSQKVVYSWVHRLCDVLRRPLSEESNWTPKMECALLAVEFLPEMIRWAVIGKQEEPLKLMWPDDDISFSINDKSIVVVAGGTRSRDVSRTSRSASIGNKNQKKKGDAKEVHQDAQRNEHNQERAPQQGHESHGRQPLMPKSLDQQLHSRMSYNQNQNGGGTLHGQADQWARGQTKQHQQPVQDVRKLSSQNAGAGDNSGRHGATPHSPELARLGFGPNTTGGGVQTHSSARSSAPTHLANSHQSTRPHEPKTPLHTNPASTSSSGVDVSAKTPFVPSAEAATNIQKALQHLQEEAANEHSSPSTTMTQSTPGSPKTTRPPAEPVTQEEIQARLAENLKKSAARAEMEKEKAASGQQSSPASPSTSSTSIRQQPIMGTAAASEVRARRSMENVQSVQEEEQQQQSAQPPLVQSSQQPDSHYEDLMKQSNENKGSMAPDPAEMNKLFTGGNGGNGLPPSLVAEQQQELAAGSSSPSSLGLTQLTSQLVHPMDHGTGSRPVHDSSSSSLTRITEASQENSRRTTAISEIEAPVMANASMEDDVFTPNAQQHLHVEVEVEMDQKQQQCFDSSFDMMPTPKSDDLIPENSFFDNCSQNGSSDNIEEMQRQDTPTVSPQMSSTPTLSPQMSSHTWTSATDSSDRTTLGQATEQMVEVRREATESNQMHQPIVATVPQQQYANGNENVYVDPTMMNMQQNGGHEVAQTSGPGYPSLFSSQPPPPVNVQQMQQHSSMEMPVQQQQSFTKEVQPPMVAQQNAYSAAPANHEQVAQQMGVQYPPVQFNQQQHQQQTQPPVVAPLQQNAYSTTPENYDQQMGMQNPPVQFNQQQHQQQPIYQQTQPPVVAPLQQNAYGAAPANHDQTSQQMGMQNSSVHFNQQQQQHQQQAQPPVVAPPQQNAYYSAAPVTHDQQMGMQHPSVQFNQQQHQQQPVYQQTQPPVVAPPQPNAYHASPVYVETSQQMGVQFNQQQQQQAPPPMIVPSNYAPSETPIIPLAVDCAEQQTQERVTSCGIPYKFSPTNSQDPSPVPSSENVEVNQQQQPMQKVAAVPASLDMFLSMIPDTTTSGNEQAAASMSNTQQGQVAMAAEIDEHAGYHRQESSVPQFPDAPSVSSTTVTTPEFNQHQSNYSNNGGQGGDAWIIEETVTANQIPATSVPLSEQQQQFSQQFQQTHRPHQSGELPQQPPPVGIPVYRDPFEQPQQQQLNQPVQSGGQAITQQSAPLPAYQDPFDQAVQQQQQTQQQQQSVNQNTNASQYSRGRGGGGYGSNQNQSGRSYNDRGGRGRGAYTGGSTGFSQPVVVNEAAPCFGTGAANVGQQLPQQHQQQNDASGQNQSQQGFGGQGDNAQNTNFHGQGQGHGGQTQNQRGGGGYRGDRRGGRGDRGGERRGGHGGGRGRGGSDHSGSGFGGGGGQSGQQQSGSGFGGGNKSGIGFGGNGYGASNQDKQGNNQQQQGGYNNNDAWGSGDNAQKNNQSSSNQGNFGGQDARTKRGFH